MKGRPRHDPIARLEALLAEADRRAPEARARWADLVAAVVRAKTDPGAIVGAGAALDEIARDKTYRLGGHATMHAMLASLGIGRTTAHKWRVLARSSSAEAIAAHGREGAYHAARPTRSRAGRSARAIGVALERLSGATPRVSWRIARGVLRVRVELPADAWRAAIGRAPTTSW